MYFAYNLVRMKMYEEMVYFAISESHEAKGRSEVVEEEVRKGRSGSEGEKERW